MEQVSEQLPKKGRIHHIFSSLTSILVHVPFLSLIVYGWWLFSRWYYFHFPALGVDLYNTVTYATYLSHNFVPTLFNWKYFWWSGHPLMGEYPVLHQYLIAPFVSLLGGVSATQLYMLGTLLTFLFFSYLIFYEISKSKSLSLLLAVAEIFSIGLYGALIWGGSLPYYGTQMFFPIVLYLFLRYLKTGKTKFLLLGSLLTGLAIYGHPQVPIVYIAPVVVMFLMLWSNNKGRKLPRTKLQNLLIFFVIVLLIAYFDMYNRIGVEIFFVPFWILAYFARFIGSYIPFLSSNGGGAGGQ